MDCSNEVPMTMWLMVHQDWVKSSDTEEAATFCAFDKQFFSERICRLF